MRSVSTQAHPVRRIANSALSAGECLWSGDNGGSVCLSGASDLHSPLFGSDSSHVPRPVQPPPDPGVDRQAPRAGVGQSGRRGRTVLPAGSPLPTKEQSGPPGAFAFATSTGRSSWRVRLPERQNGRAAGSVRRCQCDAGGARATRKPRLLFRFAGAFLLRFAERQFWPLLFQLPPRITRSEPLGR